MTPKSRTFITFFSVPLAAAMIFQLSALATASKTVKPNIPLECTVSLNCANDSQCTFAGPACTFCRFSGNPVGHCSLS